MNIESYIFNGNDPTWAVSIFVILSFMLAVAALTCWFDRKPILSLIMAFTSVITICTTAMAVM
jgi:hypothetical protein